MAKKPVHSTRTRLGRGRRRKLNGSLGRDSTRLLTPAEEFELVSRLGRLRSKMERLIRPRLDGASTTTSTDHFDQILALYRAMPRRSSAADRRIRELLGQYAAIKHRLVLANLAWVTKLARMHRQAAIPEEDMFQEGVSGLLKAIDRFETERGLRLMTYATWYIREAMQQARARQSHLVSISAHDQTLLGRIERTRTAIQHEQARTPAIEEIDRKLRRGATVLRNLQQAAAPPVSLESSSSEGSIPVAVADPAEDYERAEDVAVTVARLMAALSDRERTVVTRRFGLDGKAPTSLEELGGVLNVSKERVRQIQRQAIRRMQESWRETGFEALPA